MSEDLETIRRGLNETIAYQCGRGPKPASAQAPVENRGASQLVGSGTMVGGGLPSAEVEGFDGWLSLQITAAHRAEKISAELGDYLDAIKMRQIAQTLATAQYHFRRRVGDANERQPTSNGKGRHAEG